MIAHVGQRCLDQRWRKRYELSGIWRAVSRHIMAVLMLGERECCAAASNNSSNYRYENTHESSEMVRIGPSSRHFAVTVTCGVNGIRDAPLATS